MKKPLLIIVPIIFLFLGCGKSKKELAQEDSIKVKIERELKSMQENDEKKNSNNIDKSNNNSTKNKNSNIKIGTTSDEVLKIKGKTLSTKVVGKDDNGLIVEWEYSDVTYTMKRTSYNSPYKVAIIK